jgi:hypothetical protein
VSFVKTGARKFQASIRARRVHYLGVYDTAQEAYAEYCRAAKRMHGPFANTTSR